MKPQQNEQVRSSDTHTLANAFHVVLSAGKRLFPINLNSILGQHVMDAVSRHDPDNLDRAHDSSQDDGVLALALKDIVNAADNGQPYRSADLRGPAFAAAREVTERTGPSPSGRQFVALGAQRFVTDAHGADDGLQVDVMGDALEINGPTRFGLDLEQIKGLHRILGDVIARSGFEAAREQHQQADSTAPHDSAKSSTEPETGSQASWSITDGPMNDSQFVAFKGVRCPSCGSLEIKGKRIESDAGSAVQPASCEECEATWSETYILIGYSDLEGGIDHEAIADVVDDVKDRSENHEFNVDDEKQARDLIAASCDVLGLELSETELILAVSKLMS